MSKILKQASIILGLNIMVALLISIVAGSLGYDDKDKGTLSYSYNVLKGDFGNDSWAPMKEALEYWEQYPDRPIYHDLLIEKQVKFQYPPITLIIPKLIKLNDIDQTAFYSIATQIFLIIMILAVFGIIILSLKTYGNYLPSWYELCMLLIITTLLTLTYYPIVKAATLGQIQV